MTYIVAALIVAVVFALGVRIGFKFGVKRGFATGAHARTVVNATGAEVLATLHAGVGVYVFELHPSRQENEHASTDSDQ